ncbi:MAG: glycosyltransferase, partial [Anaerolineales bacterium]
VSDTGMGLTCPPGDAAALARGILTVLERPGDFRGDPAAVAARYSPSRTAEQFEDLYRTLLSGRRRRTR